MIDLQPTASLHALAVIVLCWLAASLVVSAVVMAGATVAYYRGLKREGRS